MDQEHTALHEKRESQRVDDVAALKGEVVAVGATHAEEKTTLVARHESSMSEHKAKLAETLQIREEEHAKAVAAIKSELAQVQAS